MKKVNSNTIEHHEKQWETGLGYVVRKKGEKKKGWWCFRVPREGIQEERRRQNQD